MIFFAPAIGKCIKKNIDTERNFVIANIFCQSIGLSLYWSSTVINYTPEYYRNKWSTRQSLVSIWGLNQTVKKTFKYAHLYKTSRKIFQMQMRSISNPHEQPLQSSSSPIPRIPKGPIHVTGFTLQNSHFGSYFHVSLWVSPPLATLLNNSFSLASDMIWSHSSSDKKFGISETEWKILISNKKSIVTTNTGHLPHQFMLIRRTSLKL